MEQPFDPFNVFIKNEEISRVDFFQTFFINTDLVDIFVDQLIEDPTNAKP